MIHKIVSCNCNIVRLGDNKMKQSIKKRIRFENTPCLFPPSRQLTVQWQPTMLKFHKESDFHLIQSQNCLLGWVSSSAGPWTGMSYWTFLDPMTFSFDLWHWPSLSEETAHPTVYLHLSKLSDVFIQLDYWLRWWWTVEWAVSSESVQTWPRYHSTWPPCQNSSLSVCPLGREIGNTHRHRHQHR